MSNFVLVVTRGVLIQDLLCVFNIWISIRLISIVPDSSGKFAQLVLLIQYRCYTCTYLALFLREC